MTNNLVFVNPLLVVLGYYEIMETRRRAMINSQEYEAARHTHSAALHVYTGVAEKYRALEVGDDEYFAARKIKDAADAAFDIAFNAEADRMEEIVEEETDDGQIELEL